MKTPSIHALVLSAGLAAFPLLALSEVASNSSPLRVDESAHALEAQTKVNPFDAIALNNEAVKTSRDGNQLDALQLLLRAHRLAPDNKAIERNFKDLNGWMAKRTSSTQTLNVDKAPRSVLPEPPALWGNPVISAVEKSDPASSSSPAQSSSPRKHRPKSTQTSVGNSHTAVRRDESRRVTERIGGGDISTQPVDSVGERRLKNE